MFAAEASESVYMLERVKIGSGKQIRRCLTRNQINEAKGENSHLNKSAANVLKCFCIWDNFNVAVVVDSLVLIEGFINVGL